jgi:hypothetical protein
VWEKRKGESGRGSERDVRREEREKEGEGEKKEGERRGKKGERGERRENGLRRLLEWNLSEPRERERERERERQRERVVKLSRKARQN